MLRTPSEDLPFEDGTFDAVVSTLVLCGVDDQLPALRELRRVLRPGARFLFLEHLRSDDPRLPRLQDWVNWPTGSSSAATATAPPWTPSREASFTITHLEHMTLPKAPKFVGPAIMGSATTPACRPQRR